jgi:hypothetical protein
MKKKYAYANIKIPVELKANGIIEPMKEYVQIEFSICNELPEKNVNNLNVMNNLHSLFHNIPNFENRPTNKIPISKSINDEIEQPLFNIRDHEEKDEEKITIHQTTQPSQTLSEKQMYASLRKPLMSMPSCAAHWLRVAKEKPWRKADDMSQDSTA